MRVQIVKLEDIVNHTNEGEFVEREIVIRTSYPFAPIYPDWTDNPDVQANYQKSYAAYLERAYQELNMATEKLNEWNC